MNKKSAEPSRENRLLSPFCRVAFHAQLLTAVLLMVLGCSAPSSDAPGLVQDDEAEQSTSQSETTSEDDTTPEDETESDPADTESENGDEEEIAQPPYAVGTTRLQVQYGDRELPLQLWYPTADIGAGQPTAHFEAPGARRDQLAALFEEAPADCVRVTMDAIQDAEPLTGTAWPLILFSHCHSCLRFSAFGIAEHLAANGFVVAAPDHVENTLFEELAGNPGPLNGDFLTTRAADIRAVLDSLLSGTAGAFAELQFDESRIGMFGHSYGAVTTGRVLQDDSRVKAGVAIAAPIENPMIPGVSVASLTRPLLYLVATEDNSITEVGNFLLRQNYDNHPAPAWKVEVTDAGHWSFSEICGLVEMFEPGCGQATRQTNPFDEVTYIDNVLARTIARDYVLAFFQYTLLGSLDAEVFLSGPSPFPDVEVSHHQ